MGAGKQSRNAYFILIAAKGGDTFPSEPSEPSEPFEPCHAVAPWAIPSPLNPMNLLSEPSRLGHVPFPLFLPP